MYMDMNGGNPEMPTPGSAVSDASKKSRTKPIRNADGILIRKDGRPDMRSVSSAMNLRKVHAKKQEAEGRSGSGEQDDTPTSATADGDDVSAGTDDSGTPTHAEDRNGDPASPGARHRENMKKIFPYGINNDYGKERDLHHTVQLHHHPDPDRIDSGTDLKESNILGRREEVPAHARPVSED